MALVVFLLAWWAAYVVFGGLREGLIIRGVRSPLTGFGEEQAPGVEEARAHHERAGWPSGFSSREA